MKILTAAEARAEHRRQWGSGKHAEWGDAEKDYYFPYQDAVDRGEIISFVQVNVPTCHIDATGDEDRVERYAERLRRVKTMGPSWVGLARKQRTDTTDARSDCPLWAKDGNHRVLAAERIGRRTVPVIMPARQYELYRRHELTNGSKWREPKACSRR